MLRIISYDSGIGFLGRRRPEAQLYASRMCSIAWSLIIKLNEQYAELFKTFKFATPICKFLSSYSLEKANNCFKSYHYFEPLLFDRPYLFKKERGSKLFIILKNII